MIASSHNRTNVFISYSHKDAKYLLRLRTHLTVYERNKLLDIWDDTKISGGALWHEEIEKALKQAKIAILLISADFLASKFIAENELPPLLAAAKAGGTSILPIILSPCGFENTELVKFQTMNPPSKPLTKMNGHQREDLWAKVAEIIGKAGLSQAILKDESLDLNNNESNPLSFYVSYGPYPSRATVRTEKQFISLRARSGAIEQYMLDTVKDVLKDIDRVSRKLITGPFRKDKEEHLWPSTQEFLMFRGAFFDAKHADVTLYIDLIHDISVQPTFSKEEIEEEFYDGIALDFELPIRTIESCIIKEYTSSDNFFELSDEYYRRLPWLSL